MEKELVKQVENVDTATQRYAKLKHAQKFLQEGAKVKAFVFFRGRTIIFKEQGEILLLKLSQALEEIGVVEVMPKLEGKKMTMVIAPIKKK